MAANGGKLWTQVEVEQLKIELDAGHDLEKIAKQHGRTPYGIVSRMVIQGWLVLHKGNYYRVAADPWELLAVVNKLQKELS